MLRLVCRRAAVAATLLLAVMVMLLGAGPAVAAGTDTTQQDTSLQDTTPLPESVTGGSGEVSTSSGAGAISRMVVGLGIVLVVIFGVYWLLKRVYGGRSGARIGEGLDVVATVPLGPNRTLQLVRIGDELVLVGVAGETVTAVRTWDAAEARRLETVLQAGPPPPPGPPIAPRPNFIDEMRKRTLRP